MWIHSRPSSQQIQYTSQQCNVHLLLTTTKHWITLPVPSCNCYIWSLSCSLPYSLKNSLKERFIIKVTFIKLFSINEISLKEKQTQPLTWPYIREMTSPPHPTSPTSTAKNKTKNPILGDFLMLTWRHGSWESICHCVVLRYHSVIRRWDVQ